MNSQSIPSKVNTGTPYTPTFGSLLRSRWVEHLKDNPLVVSFGKARIILPNRLLLWKVHRLMRNVARTQESILLSILRRQQTTDYATTYGFDQIDTVEKYRDRVPVNDFESLRPWIEKQDKGESNALNASMPVYYAMTSGTTGKPKYIPVPRQTIKVHKQIQNLGIYHLLKTLPQIEHGRILAIVSPAVEGYMEHSGIPIGSTSGRMYEEIPGIVKAFKYVLPSEVFSIEDYETKYLAILRIALQCGDISSIMTANPSTICLLGKYINDHFDALADDLETGGFHAGHRLNDAQRAALGTRLRPGPERARELRSIRARSEDGSVRLRDVWPNLTCVACWTGGSSSIFVDQLKLQLSPETLIWDIGYLASEVRATVPMPGKDAAGLPAFWHIYFEFVKREDWGSDKPKFLGLHELENGRQYYIFITTDSGLYRYNMHDIVEVSGFFKDVPLLKFVQKGKGITSITGEKLFENQIISAVEKASNRLRMRSNFYTMAADEHECRYHLYYEPDYHCASDSMHRFEDLACEVDSALQEINCEYASKRKSGRIKPVALSVLEQGTFERFKKASVDSGQREGQFKIIALLYKKDFKFDFSPHIVAQSPPSK